ncbi:MAG: RIO1 family regulatory kinase/ATPase, partial [Candidatus Aenigmatarchaeota archaeon]
LNQCGYATFSAIKELRESGAKITETGGDVLSIWDFKKHGVIKTIGTEIGVGKESVIISATTDKGFAAIKFHRYLQKEFSGIKKSLSWVAVKLRAKTLRIEDFEVDVPRAKAQVEFMALSELKGVIPVPAPYGINRHAVCMQLIGDKSVPAKRLVDIRLENPENARDVILEDYQKAVGAGWVHGDFSEYNIMITDGGDLYYIDWPQAIPAACPESKVLMERDLASIKRYFKTKYGIGD